LVYLHIACFQVGIPYPNIKDTQVIVLILNEWTNVLIFV